MPLSVLSTGTPVYGNAINVTQNSTINLDPAAASVYQFPSLTIGANTLNITGGTTGAGVTINGTTTLNAAAVFNVGSNAPLTLLGQVTGGGSLTENGSGTDCSGCQQ